MPHSQHYKYTVSVSACEFNAIKLTLGPNYVALVICSSAVSFQSTGRAPIFQNEIFLSEHTYTLYNKQELIKVSVWLFFPSTIKEPSSEGEESRYVVCHVIENSTYFIVAIKVLICKINNYKTSKQLLSCADSSFILLLQCPKLRHSKEQLNNPEHSLWARLIRLIKPNYFLSHLIYICNLFDIWPLVI